METPEQPFEEPTPEEKRASIEQLWDKLMEYNRYLGTLILTPEKQDKLDELDQEWDKIAQEVSRIDKISEKELPLLLARLEGFAVLIEAFIKTIKSKSSKP